MIKGKVRKWLEVALEMIRFRWEEEDLVFRGLFIGEKMKFIYFFMYLGVLKGKLFFC